MKLTINSREYYSQVYISTISATLCSAILFMSMSWTNAQTTIEPNSITLGVDQISAVDEDTILHWGKTRSAFRGGFFRSTDITNNNAGTNSFAYGRESQAAGDQSFSFGSFNKANETGSFALGAQNIVDGSSGFAFGVGNQVNGAQSFTMGNDLISNSIFTIILGHFNVDYTDPPNENDRPLFVLGNGDRGTNRGRSNAITVLNDGRMSLRTRTPESDLHLAHRNNSSFAGFMIQNEEGGMSGNWWRFYTRSLTDELALYNNSFMDGTSAVGEFNTSGSYSGPSDRRLKKDIVDLPYGLKDVLQLAPKRYQFRHVEDRLDIGLVAQDVLEVIPELVSYDEKDDKYMMNYDGFGVLAIKAIQ